MTGAHLSSGVDELADGRVLLHGTAARLCRWFDDQFVRLAAASGAEQYHLLPLIPRTTLQRAGYFEAFPEGAAALADEPDRPAYCLSPAVCYHVYDRLAGAAVAESLVVTAAATCHRETDRRNASALRLWEFTMREVVFVGTSAWVAAQRDRWMSCIDEFAAALELPGVLEPATDPFFGDSGRGKRLLQQLKGLKYEFRVAVGGSPLAVASFNLHETFFGERFAITSPDGGPAHSACVAFGLERWTLAFLRQRGDSAAEALISRDGG